MDTIALKSSHLYIPAAVATQVFGEESRAYVLYHAEHHVLLVAAASQQWFYKLHKPSQYMLKTRNLLGDKTIALHEMLIDHVLDAQDRPLNYTIQDNTGLLKVTL